MTHPLPDYTNTLVLIKEAPPSAILDVQLQRLNHVQMGLATETLELILARDRSNALEELGDLLWYLALGADVLEVPQTELETEVRFDAHTNHLTLDELSYYVEQFISQCKKQLIYGTDQIVNIKTTYYYVWRAFLHHCSACNVTLEYLIEQNTAKLNKRYSSSFSQEESESRPDKQEE